MFVASDLNIKDKTDSKFRNFIIYWAIYYYSKHLSEDRTNVNIINFTFFFHFYVKRRYIITVGTKKKLIFYGYFFTQSYDQLNISHMSNKAVDNMFLTLMQIFVSDLIIHTTSLQILG